MRTTRVVREGVYFGEGPRWHDDRLWYSDFYDHAVHAMDLDGNDERILAIDDQPSGLGWMPDGSLLVVSMTKRHVLRWDGTGAPRLHADLSALAPFHCNDMVVDAAGRAYVGNFGFDLDAFSHNPGGGVQPTNTVLIRVDPDGRASVAADDLGFPNGTVITPDGATLIVGESFASRLTAFDIDGDGGLSNRRVWADTGAARVAPDGICLDADGAIWVANPFAPQCLRFAEGGDKLDEVTTSRTAFACMLGGPDGRHLFILTAPSSDAEQAAVAPLGAIEVAEVDVAHAGLP
ncbi:MAG: SMP-30/gluconolactonase/LRE family protein [Actinobacteria bacterium]|nr:SMP-30/gluconolactonase/LRE family protein [Actinomycetota bacterium]